MNVDGSTFTFKGGGTLSFKYDNSALPIARGSISKLPSSAVYLVSTAQANVSKAQEELLMWHATLGHYNIAHTQKLMSASGVETEPILCPKEPGIISCSLPLCVFCLKGKARATSVSSRTRPSMLHILI